MTNKERIIAHNSLIDRAINKANSLPNAGGSTNPTASPKEVNFYDYDGTILYSYTVEEAQALTELPPLPTQPGLACQGWNYDLETIKSYNRAVNVGATYITDDGKTRLYIRIAAEGRMTVPLYFSQTVANGVTIDWGDGSAVQTLSGTGNVNTMHAYAEIGDYMISLEVTSGTLGLDNNSSSHCIMGPTNIYSKVYCNMLQRVEIGNNVTSIGDYTFNDCYSLASIAIPDGVTNIGNSAFYYCYSLVSIVIPDSVTNIDPYAFNYCGGMAIYDFTSHTSIPTLSNTNAFTGIPSDCKIKVPASLLTTWESATNWSTHASQIEDEFGNQGSVAGGGQGGVPGGGTGN